MAEPQTNGVAETNGDAEVKPTGSELPAWLKQELFEEVLSQTVDGFKEIKSFKAKRALSAGENYATLMLRVEIEVELDDGKTKMASFMVKAPHDNPMYLEMMKKHNIFDIESRMYLEIVPDFEQMYRDAGVEVKFGAQCHTLNTDHLNVMLEDLALKGFKNVNRLEGFDMDHTKCALKKLAQWHAASAKRVELKGKYEEKFTLGFFSENQLEAMKGVLQSLGEIFLKCAKSYEGYETYGEKITKLQSRTVEELFNAAKVDPNEFNVLNHGDFWANNIMFQHDAFDKIKETYFVDYQIPKYGSPAQDLLYFLISSTKYELKVKHFEYFIKYYHDNLVESLTLLKYSKKIPSLKDIHISLHKHGMWAYSTTTGVMAVVLLDPTEHASFDNFLGESETGNALKMLMYSNQRYKKHAEAVLPWLNNRGALDC